MSNLAIIVNLEKKHKKGERVMRKQEAINIAIGCVMGSDLGMSEMLEVATILTEIETNEESEEE